MTLQKIQKNVVFKEAHGHAAQNELTRHATRQKMRIEFLMFFHVWRHLCTERHMVRQHLLRGTIATEVESVILRGSETKTQKTTFSKNTMDTPHKTSWRVTRSVGNSAGNHS